MYPDETIAKDNENKGHVRARLFSANHAAPRAYFKRSFKSEPLIAHVLEAGREDGETKWKIKYSSSG